MEEIFEILTVGNKKVDIATQRRLCMASRSELIEMFKEKDLDTDGAMSYEEFIGYDTKMALAFKAIDKNGDGYLSKSEFRKICPNMTDEQVCTCI
jgi:Ca2+-binding EF-hand superfamily protein